MHNPSGEDGAAQWEADGHRSRKVAVDALLAQAVAR